MDIVTLQRALAGTAGGWLLLVASALAQPAAVPDTRSMIDALKPAPGTARNLLVRQKPAPGADPGSPAPAPTPAPPPLAPGVAPAPATPVQPAPPPAPDAPADAGLSLAIPFESNSARLRPESGNVLGNLVAALLSPELKESRFVIEGHTDARGSAAANLRLSQERADEVRLFLVTLGVHPARLKAVGKGASQPLNAASPQAPENRRVRVVAVQ